MSIDAMKQALAAIEAMLESINSPSLRQIPFDKNVQAMVALRAAIEQAQEPVAFDHGIGIDRFKVVRGAFWWHVLIGDSPTKHGKFRSRVSAEKMAADLLREFRNGAFVQHTTPRQWQGLTDQEIWSDGSTMDLSEDGIRNFARAIEAKLREKNT